MTAGWGVTVDSWQAPLPNQMLKAVRSSVITNIACRCKRKIKIFEKNLISLLILVRYPLFITENSICTSADSTIGTPCRGDEGEFLLRISFREKFTQMFFQVVLWLWILKENFFKLAYFLSNFRLAVTLAGLLFSLG